MPESIPDYLETAIPPPNPTPAEGRSRAFWKTAR